MSTLQRSDPLSLQCGYAKLNAEEGESLELSDKDEDNDEDMLKI